MRSNQRICQCGKLSRGPYHGYCGNCGSFINHPDPERDARWQEEMDRLRELAEKISGSGGEGDSRS